MPDRRCARLPWRRLGVLALLGLALWLAGCAQPPVAVAPAPEPAERFADAFERLLPIGAAMDHAAAQDARWPLGDRASMVSAAQLGCMRGAMASAVITPRQRERARRYAEAHPDTLAADLRVLESGAARLMGESLLVGAGAQKAPSSSTPEERLALAAFMTDPRFDALRQATGASRLTGASSLLTSQARGAALGQALLVSYMTDAFVRCHIPVKLLY